MALVSYSATMTAGATQVLIPAGLETPYGRCVRVSGGELREITEHHTQQKALLMDVKGDQLKIEFTFDGAVRLTSPSISIHLMNFSMRSLKSATR